MPSSTQVAPATLIRRRSSEAAADLRRQLTHQRTELRTLRNGSRSRLTIRQAVCALNHWFSWVLVVTLVTSQFTCIFWSSQTTDQSMSFGEDPTTGIYHVDGYNDEPYTDRSLVCVRQGRLYRPMQLSVVLASTRAEIEDMSGTSIGGYRVIPREQIGLEETVAQRYALGCDMLAATLPILVNTCTVLGYQTLQADDDLRVVHGVFSNTTYRVFNSLPVLMMPYWDNAIYARYAIPGTDGSACIIHLNGLYDSATENGAWVRAVNRSVREDRTVQWLGIHKDSGAVWRNGWLEDPTTGQRWYSCIASSVLPPDDKYRIRERQFDVLAQREIDCDNKPQLCRQAPIPEWWGDKFYSLDATLSFNSVVISNGSRFGLFLYEAQHRSTIHSVYDIATLISNTTVALLLFRWFTAIVVLWNAFRRGYTRKFSSPGIGCLACTRSFELLPVLLLPRMTSALAAFFTAGCRFEGEQRAMSEGWFIIYPAIAEVMLYYYSVLNVIAKILRRRMSDVLFGPSLVVLCLLHWFRVPLANSGLFEFDGRVSTVMPAKEYEKLRFYDFFSSNAALRVNGNVWSIFSIKLVVLALNLLPLVVAQKTRPQAWSYDDVTQRATNTTVIECALGIRARESAGLGVALVYHEPKTQPLNGKDNDGECGQRRLDCYELVRFGYIVFGDAVVLSVTNWLTIALMSLVRARKRVSNYRVLAFRVVLVSPVVRITHTSECISYCVELDGRLPTMYAINNPLLLDCSVWDISAVALA